MARPEKTRKSKTVRIPEDIADMVQTICDVPDDHGKKPSPVDLYDELLRDRVYKRYLVALERKQEIITREVAEAKSRGPKPEKK